jgi:stage II sporulation protein D
MRPSPRREASLRVLDRVGIRWGTAASVALAIVACSATARTRNGDGRDRRPTTTRTSNGALAPGSASQRMVRIALARGAAQVRLTSDGEWTIYAADGRTTLALPRPRESWILERTGSVISARREDSRAVSQRDMPMIVRPVDDRGTVTFNGRRWRGELAIQVTDGGLLVVNRVRMDDYLKGVVPLEIGTNAPADAAAAEAQAVAARSYAYMHLMGPGRSYDMVATVADQVYGGVNAETSLGNQAVDATAGLLLLYEGRVVNAPYHATCGGSTAEPGDAWRAGPEPYLKRVSDEIPGTDRYYCDWAPKYRWTRIFSADELRESIARYVRTLPGAGGGVKRVQAVTVTDVTPGGRVATLTVNTDRGSRALQGDAIRSALRTSSGEMLYSTYFSLYAAPGDSEVQGLTLHGGGNGHGVGMCQAGAIGRARAGQDFRTILRTYYPGTTVGPVE